MFILQIRTQTEEYNDLSEVAYLMSGMVWKATGIPNHGDFTILGSSPGPWQALQVFSSLDDNDNDDGSKDDSDHDGNDGGDDDDDDGHGDDGDDDDSDGVEGDDDDGIAAVDIDDGDNDGNDDSNS